jgi:hypothetical protein
MEGAPDHMVILFANAMMVFLAIVKLDLVRAVSLGSMNLLLIILLMMSMLSVPTRGHVTDYVVYVNANLDLR